MIPTVSLLGRLDGHAGAVYRLATGRTAELFFSGSADKVVAEWSIAELASQPFAIRLEAAVYSLCHIAQHQLLLIGQAHGGIHVIDLAQKKEIRHFAFHQQGIFDLVYAPNTNVFAASSADGSVSLWALDSFKLLRHITLTSGKARSVAFNADESLLAVACGDGSVRIIATATGLQTHVLKKHEKGANTVAWHPNGKLLVSGGRDAFLHFWNVNHNFELVRSIAAHNFAIYRIAFSPDGKWCATASQDKTVKLWEAATFDKPLRLDRAKFKGHLNSVNDCIWLGANTLVSTGDDRCVCVWRVEDGALEARPLR